MSQVIKCIVELQENKVIHVAGYRKNTRTDLDVPVYSLATRKKSDLDLHGLLAGVTSERLVEYDFVARNLISESRKANILDIGASGSGLAKAIKEYRKSWLVLGIDLVHGSDAQMDARAMGFRDGAFDQVLSISTIEHIANLTSALGDEVSMLEMRRVMKHGGRAIITVPYGRPGRGAHRVYNRRSLERLVRPFVVSKMEFYIYNKGKWRRCSQKQADSVEPPIPLRHHSSACVCLLLVSP